MQKKKKNGKLHVQQIRKFIFSNGIFKGISREPTRGRENRKNATKARKLQEMRCKISWDVKSLKKKIGSKKTKDADLKFQKLNLHYEANLDANELIRKIRFQLLHPSVDIRK